MDNVKLSNHFPSLETQKENLHSRFNNYNFIIFKDLNLYKIPLDLQFIVTHLH